MSPKRAIDGSQWGALILLQVLAFIFMPLKWAILVIPILMGVALPVVLYEREYLRRKAEGKPTGWMSFGIGVYFVLMFIGLGVLHWQKAVEQVYGG